MTNRADLVVRICAVVALLSVYQPAAASSNKGDENMTTVWLLVYIYFHSAPAIGNLPSQEECERLYQKLAANRWAGAHECIPYQVSR